MDIFDMVLERWPVGVLIADDAEALRTELPTMDADIVYGLTRTEIRDDEGQVIEVPASELQFVHHALVRDYIASFGDLPGM